eukprot:1814903-Amphidinium_carterae.1
MSERTMGRMSLEIASSFFDILHSCLACRHLLMHQAVSPWQGARSSLPVSAFQHASVGPPPRAAS